MKIFWEENLGDPRQPGRKGTYNISGFGWNTLGDRRTLCAVIRALKNILFVSQSRSPLYKWTLVKFIWQENKLGCRSSRVKAWKLPRHFDTGTDFVIMQKNIARIVNAAGNWLWKPPRLLSIQSDLSSIMHVFDGTLEMKTEFCKHVSLLDGQRVCN